MDQACPQTFLCRLCTLAGTQLYHGRALQYLSKVNTSRAQLSLASSWRFVHDKKSAHALQVCVPLPAWGNQGRGQGNPSTSTQQIQMWQ